MHNAYSSLVLSQQMAVGARLLLWLPPHRPTYYSGPMTNRETLLLSTHKEVKQCLPVEANFTSSLVCERYILAEIYWLILLVKLMRSLFPNTLSWMDHKSIDLLVKLGTSSNARNRWLFGRKNRFCWYLSSYYFPTKVVRFMTIPAET